MPSLFRQTTSGPTPAALAPRRRCLVGANLATPPQTRMRSQRQAGGRRRCFPA